MEGSALEPWKKERIIISQHCGNYKKRRVPSVPGVNPRKAHLFPGCYIMTGLSVTADEPHPGIERAEVIFKCAFKSRDTRTFLKSQTINSYIAERNIGQPNLLTIGCQGLLTVLKLSL